MYPNLNAEMARRGIVALILSERVGIPYSTLLSKLSGKTSFTVGEAKKIKIALGTELSIDELFASEEVS